MCGIVTTGKEALQFIKEEKVDLIILDLNLPDMSGVDILNYILEENISKYNNSILVLTGEMGLLTKVIGNKLIFNYHSKVNGIDPIIKDLKQIVTERDTQICIDKLKSQIQNELNKLNFNFSYSGTRYLCDCIEECYYKGDIYSINLETDIYSILSKKHNNTINSIKSSIFKSILAMYCETTDNKLSDYFGYRIIMKPKTKEVISIILQKIK